MFCLAALLNTELPLPKETEHKARSRDTHVCVVNIPNGGTVPLALVRLGLHIHQAFIRFICVTVTMNALPAFRPQLAADKGACWALFQTFRFEKLEDGRGFMSGKQGVGSFALKTKSEGLCRHTQTCTHTDSKRIDFQLVCKVW